MSFTVRVSGRKNIPPCGRAALIVASHETYMDPFIVASPFRVCHYIRWVTKSSLRSRALMEKDAEVLDKKLHRSPSWITKRVRSIWYGFSIFCTNSLGAIIIDPSRSTVDRIVQLLKSSNEMVGIFPAGARRFVKKDPRVHKSFVVIAREANVPIIPVRLRRRSLLRLHLDILPPIMSDQLTDKTFGSTDYERAKNIMRLIDDRF